MMVQPRSASCYEIGFAPKADGEDIGYFDDLDDGTVSEPPTAFSQRSSIVTSASSRVSLISRASIVEALTRETKGSKRMVVCRIALLDGTTFEPKGIDKNSEGQHVFEKVAKHLDVIETDYFGLTYRDKSGKKFWLDNTKKISKQVKGGTWVFEFQVKFYPPDPMSLKEDVTRYQVCLQVRVDIFNGRLPCSFATYALLGSYTVQAELGDWDIKDYGNSLGYLNDFDFSPQQNQELLEKIQELHMSHKGQTPVVAEAHFLENAKKLAMYGVDMHDVKDSENKSLSLGISASGILVYKDRLRINRFVWPKILKLSYKRNTFYIKIRPSEYEPHERTIGFLCDNHKLAKRLWKTCVEHHAFFRLKTADAPNSDTLFPRFNTRFRYSGRTAIQARKAAELQHREEPHIARTAERRSLSEKANKNGPNASSLPVDESDMYDQKHGDPDATLERDRNLQGLDNDGRYLPGNDTADRHDYKGDEPGSEGPPGYAADSSGLADGGKKSKKDKEEEKKRKKEEERRRKEEEKERKRLEKERKKGHHAETNIDGDEDQAMLEQKPKPVPTWALPCMKEMLEKRAITDQKQQQKAQETEVKLEVPLIKVEEVNVDELENLDPETQEYETDYNTKIIGSHDAQETHNQSETCPENVVVQSDFIKGEYSSVVESAMGGHPCSSLEVSKTEQQLKEDYTQLLRETPDITSQSRLEDVKHKIDHDARYQAVDNDDRRQRWFNEYVDDMLKADFMRLLRETPTIHSQSSWPEARLEVDRDPRFEAVGDEKLREQWFDEYVHGLLKSEFMQLLKETPAVHSQSRWDGVRDYLENDPRYQAVASDPQREAWFDEYIENLKKDEFQQLLADTPSVTSYSRYPDVREDISNDPRFQNIDNEEQRQTYFDEYIQNLKKANYVQLLQDTPDITAYSQWHEAKHMIGTDPRYHAVDTELQRAKWFNEYVNRLAGIGYTDYGLKIGDYKSIDRKEQTLPLNEPSVAMRRNTDEPMAFFENSRDSEYDSYGRKKVPPPIARKPKGPGGYDSEEDRLLNNGVPVTVETESYKYKPDASDVPRSTSNIPTVETKTHKVTYEKDGVPYEIEDTYLISAHSVTTKSQTIDTTTYKTERDGVIETRVERKVTVTTDEDDDLDHDAMLRAAIEDVTNMNPDLSVVKIECMRQIEEVNDR